MSRIFKFSRIFLPVFLFSAILLAAGPETMETMPSALDESGKFQATLIGIASYKEARDLKQALSQVEGVSRVDYASTSSGLTVFNLQYSGESKKLVEKLNNTFPDRYAITDKTLPSGLVEVTIQKKK